ncbi:MAG: hypothetical protein KC731_29330 [Myxococcales bacterium]|nr:hypothetical protein [Myxococcales bacterium]
MGTLNTPRKKLVEDLKTYGEDQVATKIRGLSKRDYERLSEIAFTHALTGMLVAKALALAAVEVVEGAPRDLARKRRIFPK